MAIEECFATDEETIQGNKKEKKSEKKQIWRKGGLGQSNFFHFLCWFDNCCCSRYFLCLQSVHFNESQTPVCEVHAVSPV